mmetsp:Transcript_24290/g.30110  ORF Transcript_24290/g.30110 Transcript_24290/m.30110 type:complete len:164 (+) Transcript_24290:179-670(+)
MRYRLKNDPEALERYELESWWSPTRTLRQGVTGMCFHVIPMHFWITRLVPNLTVSTKLIAQPRLNYAATLFWRMFLHTIVILPYMQFSILFGIGSLKGGSPQAGMTMTRERFRDGFSFALVYWPWAYIGLYTMVPPKYGNLYMDFFALGWYTLVSFVANKHKD